MMRYFVLVDLTTQAEMLPYEIQSWPQERFLSWLRLFGEVSPWPLRRVDEHGLTDQFITVWRFCAPTGIATGFVISKNRQFALLAPDVHQIWGEKFTSLYNLDT